MRNVAGVLQLEGAVHAHLDGICDRCAEPFTRDVTFPLEAILVTELEDEENEDEAGYFCCRETAQIWEDIITTSFVLQTGAPGCCARRIARAFAADAVQI